MPENIETFLKPLMETHFSLKDYVDFPKVAENVEAISIKLNQLNYLIGREDIGTAVKRLWDENPKAFSVLDILIAIRKKDRKKAIDSTGNTHLISDYFTSAEKVIEFLDETGLTHVFQSKQIKNLVDYVFGVEAGLDSNARKNRSGHIMERLVANHFSQNGIAFEQEVYYDRFPEIKRALGADKKRFDFVVCTPHKTYLIEVNFFTGGGSKLNEVARSYSELAPRINAVPGFEFVWITDGIGWKDARNKLEEAFEHVPSIYNLSNIHEFIDRLKQ